MDRADVAPPSKAKCGSSSYRLVRHFGEHISTSAIHERNANHRSQNNEEQPETQNRCESEYQSRPPCRTQRSSLVLAPTVISPDAHDVPRISAEQPAKSKQLVRMPVQRTQLSVASSPTTLAHRCDRTRTLSRHPSR